ncbi:hypothetical protein [Mycoplasma sp. Mirounga ES2805-ORL]|uniref:hypothetical protein n=1 Tax=Mycoplasma sp. Mirounga ES2805-ORL TaxID=754514 RepID=UPI00197B69AC|nr:hypothetical protein [Mycoplasma sp. Mirounga ES2805-ORL]QSF13763.1 hypothetical protein JXZ90_00470 [Mycoplasma sp. Mirounga ES2805-ORL]
MKKIFLGSLSAFAIAATPILAVSCGTKSPKEKVEAKIEDYINAAKEKYGYSNLDKKQKQDVDKIIDEALKPFRSLISDKLTEAEAEEIIKDLDNLMSLLNLRR